MHARGMKRARWVSSCLDSHRVFPQGRAVGPAWCETRNHPSCDSFLQYAWACPIHGLHAYIQHTVEVQSKAAVRVLSLSLYSATSVETRSGIQCFAVASELALLPAFSPTTASAGTGRCA
eukprot:6170338-Pleurochrysis_carterae.AAC.2